MVRLAVVAATLLIAPPAAPAATVTLGSDLSATADQAETHPVDTAFWATKFGSGAPTVMPTDGQVNVIRLKGMAVPSSQTLAGGPPPFTLIHFQTIRPTGDGNHQVIVTSEDFQAPFLGDPNQITSYQSDFLCVKAGDRIAFNNTGGYNPGNGYPDGVPFRMFGSVAGSVTDQYTKADGTNNGQTLTGRGVEGQELLMQVDLGTGPDARPACGGTKGQPPPTGGGDDGGGTGGGTTPPSPRATIPRQSPHLRKRSILSVAIFCHGPSTAPCSGRLRVTAAGKTIGSTAYTIAARTTKGVRFRFNRTGRRLFRKGGNRLRVTAAATTDGLTSSRSFTVTKR